MGKVNLTLLWTVLLGTLSGSLWIFNNIAWASDIQRIEVRLIKQDLRDLQYELRHESDESEKEEIRRLIEELLDDLCAISPEDRECK